MEFKHKSVLLDETVGGLNIKPDGIYVDGTLGGAGHAIEVCRKLSAKGRFIGIDQDQDAIIAASEPQGEFTRLMVLFWIWEYPTISWTMRNVDLPIG